MLECSLGSHKRRCVTSESGVLDAEPFGRQPTGHGRGGRKALSPGPARANLFALGVNYIHDFGAQSGDVFRGERGRLRRAGVSSQRFRRRLHRDAHGAMGPRSSPTSWRTGRCLATRRISPSAAARPCTSSSAMSCSIRMPRRSGEASGIRISFRAPAGSTAPCRPYAAFGYERYAIDVIETDWASYTFTMNWMFTCPGTVRFEQDEPFCHIFPLHRGELETVEPEIRPFTAVPELQQSYEVWKQS